MKADAQCSKPVDGEYHVYQLYEYDEVDGELKKVDVWVTIYEWYILIYNKYKRVLIKFNWHSFLF